MAKKYMTVEDLYKFCLNNNFNKFSSVENNNDEIVVQMKATFEKEEKSADRFTEGMTPFVSRAFHDHINLNKSEIKEESFVENLPSSHLRPILANIVKDEETGELDFGSHDFHIEIDEDGNEKTVYDEQPVGVIDGTLTEIEYDEEAGVNRAVLKGYLYDGYCQDTINILNRRKQTDCSVELSIREMSFNSKDKVLTLDDWYVSALSLLGSDIAPGMAGSNLKIEDFSMKNSSVVENLNNNVNDKLVELLEKIEEKLSNININNYSNGKEDSKMESVENKFEEEVTTIVEEEVTDTETTEEEEVVTVAEEETEEAVDETPEVEENFEEDADEEDADAESGIEPLAEDEDEDEEGEDPEVIPGDDETAEVPRRYTISDGTNEVSFEISHEDIRYALYNLISQYDEMDNEWYGIDKVYDDHFIMIGWCTDAIYGQKYTVDGDNVALDGERWRLYAEYVTETEKATLEEMRANYSIIKAELEKYQKMEMQAAKSAILNSAEYEVLADNAEFCELKANMDNYSEEELRTKADLIFAKFMKANFAAEKLEEAKPRTINFSSLSAKEDKEKSKKPYGGIFEKYNK